MIFPSEAQERDEVAGHYDELDRVYREIWGEHVHHGYWRTGSESSLEAVEALADLVGERLEPEKGEHLCDIGCGYGATAARFAERHGVRVTGVTLSGAQQAIARARPGPVEFLVRDWLSNDFPDGMFDCAYAIESTEHMADRQRFFDEAWRTIRPGGRLVVCAWLAAPRPSTWEVNHLLEPICREGRLPGMGTRDEYEGMARRSGFHPLGYEDISRQVRRTWRICAARLLGRVATDGYYRKLLLSRETRNRSFALSIPRLIIAYRTGAMRYGLFTFKRVEGNS